MGGVSRETDDVSAGLISQLFPGNDKAICRYVDLLTTAGVQRGLIGPREVPRLWRRHILNCAVIAPAFAPNSTVCDIGSGAGLPGVVLALARRDLEVTLLEPLLRRTAFLSEAVALLGLPNAEVVRGRAEEWAGRRTFDYVTARAVAPLERLAGWGLPLCRPGGELVAMKGASAAEEVQRARGDLARLKAGAVTIEEYGGHVVSPPTTVVRIESSGHHPPRSKGNRQA